MRAFDDLGAPETFNHYPIGWAMAFNTPYKLFKRYASHEGGIADTAIVSWPAGIGAHGEVRDNYVNVCDVTPTIYDLLGIEPPETVGGYSQQPLDGVSFKAALEDPAADTGKGTQFYTMLGTRGIWHDGWFANTVHPASPAGWSHFADDRWELFHIESDRSQCHDLAAEHPEKLEELKALWFAEADKYNGLPLADLNMLETIVRFRPMLSAGRNSFTYYPGTAEVGIGAVVELRGQSFSALAEVTIDSPDAAGVLFKHGAGHGGHVLFVRDGRLHYIYNFMGEDEQLVSSTEEVPLGDHILGVRFERTGTVPGSHTPLGVVSLYIDDAVVGTRADVRTHPMTFGLSGGGLSVGRNAGQTVSRSFTAPFEFTGGSIAKLIVDTSGTPYVDVERELAMAFAKD
jgi:arylsulfatase